VAALGPRANRFARPLGRDFAIAGSEASLAVYNWSLELWETLLMWSEFDTTEGQRQIARLEALLARALGPLAPALACERPQLLYGLANAVSTTIRRGALKPIREGLTHLGMRPLLKCRSCGRYFVRPASKRAQRYCQICRRRWTLKQRWTRKRRQSIALLPNWTRHDEERTDSVTRGGFCIRLARLRSPHASTRQDSEQYRASARLPSSSRSHLRQRFAC
jgi:hypothetical protein